MALPTLQPIHSDSDASSSGQHIPRITLYFAPWYCIDNTNGTRQVVWCQISARCVHSGSKVDIEELAVVVEMRFSPEVLQTPFWNTSVVLMAKLHL